MEENSRKSGTAETASHAAINNSYVVYLLHFHRNWKSMLVSELGVDQTEFDGTDSRSGSVCWACCGKEHRNDDADVDDDDDDGDEDDIRVEVGTEKLAIVSGNSEGIWTHRAIKIFTGLVKSRTLWLTEDENINESAETREICALATYVIAYNFYRTTANQQGVKTRPHPAIRRGAKGRNENEHCIQSICGVPPSLSLSLLFFSLTFSFGKFLPGECVKTNQ